VLLPNFLPDGIDILVGVECSIVDSRQNTGGYTLEFISGIFGNLSDDNGWD